MDDERRAPVARRRWMTWAVLALAAGCAAPGERRARSALEAASAPGAFDPAAGPGEADAPVTLDGSLDAYVRHGMRGSPSLRGAYARWHAAVATVSRGRRLPEPEVTYAYFVRSVETRVGPQRHRLGVRQRFPWPTRLTAAADAGARRAEAARRAFEAEALGLAARVARRYWRLWSLRAVADVAEEQVALLAAVSESTRGRVEVGAATLADLLQVNLRLARQRDRREMLAAEIRGAEAALLAEVGAAPGRAAATTDAPLPGGPPPGDVEALRSAAAAHPRVLQHGDLAASGEADLAGERAARWPTLGVGLDWIATGDAAAPGVEGSGRDAVLVSVQASVPLWGGTYADAEEAARARVTAHHADAAAAALDAEARLADALARIGDAHRRIALHRDVLVPQAEAVHEALSGGYATGAAPLVQLLESAADLLTLREALVGARAAHAIAWADLEEVVGRPVAGEGVDDGR